MADTNLSYNGGWFIPLLTVLFIGLKLTGHIDWSWFWVLSPILIGIGMTFFFAILGIGLLALGYFKKWW